MPPEKRRCCICGRRIHLGRDYARICQGGGVQWFCGKHFDLLGQLVHETQLLGHKVNILVQEFEKTRQIAQEILQKLYRPARKT